MTDKRRSLRDAIAEDADGEFIADHHLLHQQLARIACGEIDCGLEVGVAEDA